MTFRDCRDILFDCHTEECFTKEWCEQTIIESKANKGKGIPARTWKALFNNHLLKDNGDNCSIGVITILLDLLFLINEEKSTLNKIFTPFFILDLISFIHALTILYNQYTLLPFYLNLKNYNHFY